MAVLSFARTPPLPSWTCSQPAASSPHAAPRTRRSEPSRSTRGPSRSSSTSPARRSRASALRASASERRAASLAHHRKGLPLRSRYEAPAVLRTVTQPAVPSRTARHRTRCRPRLPSSLVSPRASTSSPTSSFLTFFADWIANSSVTTISRATVRKSASEETKALRMRPPCGAIFRKASLAFSAGTAGSPRGPCCFARKPQNCASATSPVPSESSAKRLSAS
mmetsp:Transcript_25336/g.79535  ORF Transcript_25336/g.79535 Transcript_25336/m.79535 type:complete len:222 (+) Transcript_25336:1055-1720(+)